MKTFPCQCGNTLYFRNTQCVRCHRPVGYSPQLQTMLSLPADANFNTTSEQWTHSNTQEQYSYTPCKNYIREDACNWLVDPTDQTPYCRACRLNEMIPDLSQPRHREYWYRIESAKRHLLYNLFTLGLPVGGKQTEQDRGLSFVFIENREIFTESPAPELGMGPAITGHNQGRITLNIEEADPVTRTQTRESLQEPYRTLLGHFRHEIGHYYWDKLIAPGPYLENFRQLFGNETQDYNQSREQHYANGPASAWQDHYISAYASMHPWEDWAETWAHYLHMTDTLETAADCGFIDTVPQFLQPIETTLEQWEKLTLGLNATARSMGLPDSYPFVLNASVRQKMAFIHTVITDYGHAKNDDASSLT